jgi:hypothetical protein
VPHSTSFECNTKKIEGTDISQYSLSFKNRYCEVEIRINYGGWGAGLGSLRRYVEAKNKGGDYGARMLYLEEHYAFVNLELEFQSSFNWFWALFPPSDDYFNWVEYLNDKLEEYFNFDREDIALRNSKEEFELD